jgi:hypothetical protein
MQDNNGFSPLVLAAQNGHEKVVEFLSKKFRPTRDEKGKAMWWAVKHRHNKITVKLSKEMTVVGPPPPSHHQALIRDGWVNPDNNNIYGDVPIYPGADPIYPGLGIEV